MNQRTVALLLASCLVGCPEPSEDAPVLRREGEPAVHTVDRGNTSMAAAIQEARDTVQTFVQRVEAGDGSERMMFKVPFGPEGQAEHMWVSNVRVEGGQLVGILDNEPTVPMEVKVGDEVRRDPEQVSDWMIVQDGKLVGGFTIRAIRNAMTDAEREAFDASVDFSF